jgi:hypothetical protein
MNHNNFVLEEEEVELLDEIEKGEWVSKPLSDKEKKYFSQSAKYTKSLTEKKTNNNSFFCSRPCFD